MPTTSVPVAAREVLASWDAAQRELARAATGTLVVGMQTSPGRGLLPLVRARLSEECPAAQLKLRQVGWEDPTAGLGDRSCDAAFVWRPLPREAQFSWRTIARERRFVALPAGHRLAGHAEVAMADLRDEPFLALPAANPVARAFWLASDQRGGHPVTVAAEIRDSEETYEAVATGLGVCLLAEGNIPILDRGGVATVPVRDLPPAELVLAWRRGDHGLLLDGFAALCAEVASRPAQSTSAPASANPTGRTAAQPAHSGSSRATTPATASARHQTSTLGPAPEMVAPSAPNAAARSTRSSERG